MDENLKKIKEIILKVANEMKIEIDKIILFGSRARGDYKEESDYDILIVTKEKLEREKEKKLDSKIRIGIINLLDVSIDLFIVSKEEFERYKDVKWSISGAAASGIVI